VGNVVVRKPTQSINHIRIPMSFPYPSLCRDAMEKEIPGKTKTISPRKKIKYQKSTLFRSLAFAGLIKEKMHKLSARLD